MTFPFPHSGGRRKQEEEAPQLAACALRGAGNYGPPAASSDVNTLTPIECMTQLFELTTLAKKDT